MQRGITTNAGIVTIKEVDMDKTIVLSASKGSAGYVAARGTISKTNLNIPAFDYGEGKEALMDYMDGGYYSSSFPPLSGTISSTTLSGGTTDLTVKEYSARLISSTELECDGPVEWQVIEFK